MRFDVVRTTIAIFVGALVLVASFLLAYGYYSSAAEARAGQRVALYQTILSAALERYQHLPFVLSSDPFVIDALQNVSPDLNPRFEQFAQESGADAIYLMDRTGLTIAASNWQQPVSFLGQNYGFRPYFQSALAGDTGVFFAIGATTRQPGYFIARGVKDDTGLIIGVIAVKVDLRPLEDTWRSSGEDVFVSNTDGVITLSSNNEWRYRTIGNPDAATRETIAARRQFADEPLTPLAMNPPVDNSFAIERQQYVHATSQVGYLGWHLHFLSPLSQVFNSASFVALIVLGVELLIALGIVVLRSKRIGKALLVSQRTSSQLRELNETLQIEIEERKRTEEALRATQRDLDQANKLAVLGQLSASVGHELSQPLAAMKTYLASARLPGEDNAETFERMDGLVTRMDKITRQLKFFSRKRSDAYGDVDVTEAIDNALKLLDEPLERAGISPSVIRDKTNIYVRADKLQLEQVIINLVNNSIHALNTAHEKLLQIETTANQASVTITVSDNGAGFDEGEMDNIFEPFFTTKPSGEGTGLGLAISSTIIHELGGTISASRRAPTGAAFSVELARVTKQ
ncbi:MAG: ATP-binding protein [Pseudomonadota bacterium]